MLYQTMIRSTGEERQCIVTDIQCQMMSRKTQFWSVACHIQNDEVPKRAFSVIVSERFRWQRSRYLTQFRTKKKRNHTDYTRQILCTRENDYPPNTLSTSNSPQKWPKTQTVSTWCLFTILTDSRELTTHVVLKFATSASEIQTVHISWNWSVYEWRLWEDISNYMTFQIFRVSHWSDNDAASREATLTKHVNVDEVARHSTIRSSRIATLLGQTTCSKQRERFEGTRRAWSSRICSVGQIKDKHHNRQPQWSRMRKDHLTSVTVDFDS